MFPRPAPLATCRSKHWGNHDSLDQSSRSWGNANSVPAQPPTARHCRIRQFRRRPRTAIHGTRFGTAERCRVACDTSIDSTKTPEKAMVRHFDGAASALAGSLRRLSSPVTSSIVTASEHSVASREVRPTLGAGIGAERMVSLSIGWARVVFDDGLGTDPVFGHLGL